MKKFSCDFETAVWLPEESFVWAWASCEIGNEENITIETDIKSFMKYLEKHSGSTFYFHNLKFDGEFIISELLKEGFTFVKDRKEAKDKTFTTLISNFGVFYQITIYFQKHNHKVKKVTIIDSLKIIPFSVEQIAKAFDLKEQKLEIDYMKERSKFHRLTKEEKEYISHDVIIVAKALNVIFSEGLTKMTQGSNALSDFIKIVTKNKFEHYFPELTEEIDSEIRKAYKGGFTYLNPIYKEKDVGKGVVLDVNSLYPSVMYNEKLPYGEPIFYEGKYKNDKVYDLFVQMLSCSFKLKKNKIPMIQIKNDRFHFKENEYLESSNDEVVILTLTSVDLEMFLNHYEVEDLNYIAGWKFKSISGIFTKYIDKWITRKIQATKDKNKGQRTLAKLMLNALYGKFATSLEVQNKEPYLDNDGIVKYALGEKEKKKGLYIPVGCFITAYARRKTIETSQAIKEYSINKYGKDLYIYSDTDSIHTLLPISELTKFCEIDDYKLGAFKHEASFTKARFIRQKCYIEEIENEIKITCAGLPSRCYNFVTWENFRTRI